MSAQEYDGCEGSVNTTTPTAKGNHSCAIQCATQLPSTIRKPFPADCYQLVSLHIGSAANVQEARTTPACCTAADLELLAACTYSPTHPHTCDPSTSCLTHSKTTGSLCCTHLFLLLLVVLLLPPPAPFRSVSAQLSSHPGRHSQPCQH
jgi:hypothetical protein